MPTEPSLQHRVIPGIAAFARGGLPEPPITDDSNSWTDGYCWLFCRQQWTRVLWIGPANVAGAQAPMYACGPYINELQERIWQAILLSDGPAPRSTHPPAGEAHSATESPRAKDRSQRG
ncbi:hypothetical protein OG552_15585 [Streptomyces sp. NBC_01476]|uniref:hypothetical protein n=1 Tax=Streptomyces sp. NBC_01476 TaxID=2903881 RepID=UPI002E36715F|nr:hypothetical protein [Streptomyces sp. NBC_01476]